MTDIAEPSRRASIPSMRDVQRLLASERLSIDDPVKGRTCFLSHLGAQRRLTPSPWIAHRDLLHALTLATLTPEQRTSLARAVIVDYRRQFGVGRLLLDALPSGLPCGGSSLRFSPRRNDWTGLYTWALGHEAAAVPCDWLLLRAAPEWAPDEAPPQLRGRGLHTLAALGGQVIVLVASASAAVEVARACRSWVSVSAHPRFSPYLTPDLQTLPPTPSADEAASDAEVVLWPHDALRSPVLTKRNIAAVVPVEAPEPVVRAVTAWCRRRDGGNHRLIVQPAACPGRAGRPELEQLWRGCGQPRILLRGDPGWSASGARWLRSIGAEVEVQGEATQLELL